jgi:protein dithiol oxidoreductase (disulfide-forming)
VPCSRWVQQDHGKEPAIEKLATPQPTDDKNKIEVIEFFWYGCPHCNQLEPAVEVWEKTLPKDVVFRREHILWDSRRETRGQARLFVTLRTMGILAQHQRAVFDAVHTKKVKFQDEKVAFDWVAQRGIDRAKFESTYKSFGVETQVNRAKQMTDNYRIDGVPKFAINGKYMTSPHQAGSEAQMFAIINGLITQERGARR